MIGGPIETEFWLKLAAATLCGAIIGSERQLRGKPAGLRTSILICIGTELFIDLGAGLNGPGADPTRVLGQVVTGVGFLGAGVIVARGEIITGVTTAATIWVLAAVGASIGVGRLAEGIAVSIATVLILTVLRVLEIIIPGLNSSGDHRSGGNGETND